MEGDVLKKARRGLGLWELSLGIVLAVCAAGAVIVAYKPVIEAARGQRTLEDMRMILETCRQYDALHARWPSSWADLQDLLPAGVSGNMWGYPFVIVSGTERVWVETEVPVGAVARSLKGAYVVTEAISGRQRVRLSVTRSQGPSARLVYEKRNVYGF